MPFDVVYRFMGVPGACGKVKKVSKIAKNPLSACLLCSRVAADCVGRVLCCQERLDKINLQLIYEQLRTSCTRRHQLSLYVS